jgi:hypothetical protein
MDTLTLPTEMAAKLGELTAKAYTVARLDGLMTRDTACVDAGDRIVDFIWKSHLELSQHFKILNNADAGFWSEKSDMIRFLWTQLSVLNFDEVLMPVTCAIKA